MSASGSSKAVRAFTVVSLLISVLVLPRQIASAEVTQVPKGVSQELWKVYQDLVIREVDGVERNLRWTIGPKFYLTGTPTAADYSSVQLTLAEITKYCNGIIPSISTNEPLEGVYMHYITPSKFKAVISNTPSTENETYATSWYYLNRGLTKFVTVISTELIQATRDFYSRYRVLQGMGFKSTLQNANLNLFSSTFVDLNTSGASELDKQILRLYCSSYSRSWDTAQNTYDAIAGAWTKKLNIPYIGLSVKVAEYKNQINFSFDFDRSTALDNQLTGIDYVITDSNGVVAKSGSLDLSENLFKSHEVVLNEVKANNRYKMEAFPVNALGRGTSSKGEGSPGNQLAPGTTEVPKVVTNNVPAGDVSCITTDNGVQYSASMTFGAGSISIGDLTYDWDFSILDKGGNPAISANYSPKQFFKSSSSNSLSVTYNELLNLASNNPTATILVYVSPKNTVGSTVTRNTSGTGCYVYLPTVLSSKIAAEAKTAADKAAAELKAKQEADTKAAAEKAAAEKAAADLKAKQESELRAAAEQAAAELKAKQEADAKVRAAALKKTTITCVKGKQTKKVTAVKPVCPVGYKKKV